MLKALRLRLKQETVTASRLVLIPKIDAEEFPLHLSPPTASNCGGYILPSAGGTVYAYSPIDLAVAAIEAKRRDLILTDLSTFYRVYTDNVSIFDVYIGMSNVPICDIIAPIVINNIVWWQRFAKGELLATLHKNAPFNFRT